MRLALLSDIHGNTIALDAVLADIQAQGGVDAYWVLGDFVTLGPDPVGALERVARLPNLRCVYGNTDRYLTTGHFPPPTMADTQANPALVPKLVEVSTTFAWTMGAVAVSGWLAWLEALPLEQRVTLPDGTRLLGVHAAPGTDDGQGINPSHSDDDLRVRLAGCEADLVCVGHTHWPLDRRVDGVRVVNLGSIGNPQAPDLRASYVLLEADSAGYRLQHRRVPYDTQAVIETLHRIRHPGRDYILAFYQGQRRPPWSADM